MISIYRAIGLKPAIDMPIGRTVGVAIGSVAIGGVAIGVAIGMTIGNPVCSICAFDSPVFIDAFFHKQRKSNHQVHITSGLISKDISKLMCESSVIPTKRILVSKVPKKHIYIRNTQNSSRVKDLPQNIRA
jgi:hypothetical protein